jgi:peptidoglycan glycosyltransferase
MNRQIRLLGLVLIMLFLALFVNLNWIQVVHADSYAHDPRNGRIAFKQFSKARGVIQTSDGVVLARSVPADDAFKLQRQYPEGSLFGHITGFFSFTFGSEGVESTYGKQLAAHQASKVRNFQELLHQRQETNDVTLTLTKKLQLVAQGALGNRKGVVIAIDPTTGAVLAMWSFPSFDPNALSSHDPQAVRTSRDNLLKDPANPMLPRAFRERYPPGSTFKVITSSAVLDKAPDLATKAYPSLSALSLPNTRGQKL